MKVLRGSYFGVHLVSLSFSNSAIQCIQNQFFIGGPERCEEQSLWSVAGYAVNHGVGWKEPEALDDEGAVFVEGQRSEGLRFIHAAELCAAEDVKELELDAVEMRIQCAEITDGREHVVVGFPWEAEDDMDDDGEVGGFQAVIGIVKYRERIAAVDTFGGHLMDRLESELDPDVLAGCFSEPAKHREHLVRETVGTGSEGERDDFRLCEGFPIERFEALDRSVGVRIGLEVRDVLLLLRRAVLRELRLDTCLREPELLLQRKQRCREIAGPALRAEYTAAIGERAVPIRAGAAGLKRKLIDLCAIFFF